MRMNFFSRASVDQLHPMLSFANVSYAKKNVEQKLSKRASLKSSPTYVI